MKSRKLIVPFVLATSLFLAACSGTNNETEDQNTTMTTVSISEGAKEMRHTITDLKAQITAKDTAKVKESGENLEKSWQTFEDGVKDKDADLYEKVETPLHTIEAGVKVQPLDEQVLNKAADELDQVLADVETLK